MHRPLLTGEKKHHDTANGNLINKLFDHNKFLLQALISIST